MSQAIDSDEDSALQDCPNPLDQETPTSYASRLGSWYKESSGQSSTFQVFTPPKVAMFMASKCVGSDSMIRVLDPGVGIGVLSSAIIETYSEKNGTGELTIDAIDNDANIIPYSKKALAYASKWAALRGVSVSVSVLGHDFLEFGISKWDEMEQHLSSDEDGKYDIIIMNPPYFKIASSDARVGKIAKFAGKQTNIYSLFLSVAAIILKPGGKLVSINPRSFASGRYFQEFRKSFFKRLCLREVHLFHSRKNVFRHAGVLQETLILFADAKKNIKANPNITISTSQCIDDLCFAKNIEAPYDVLISGLDDQRLAIPTSFKEKDLLERIDLWEDRLSTLQLEICTGPVVPFRVRDLLLNNPSEETKSVPLLWMNNISRMRVLWPQHNGKQEYFIDNDFSKKFLTTSNRFVLLRRFSTKEDNRRLTAAVMPERFMSRERIGLENHVNYIHSKSGRLEKHLAIGLAGLLNSSIMDRYFRILNGNTQVNVYDIVQMPLPSRSQLQEIGSLYSGLDMNSNRRIEMIDSIIHNVVGFQIE